VISTQSLSSKSPHYVQSVRMCPNPALQRVQGHTSKKPSTSVFNPFHTILSHKEPARYILYCSHAALEIRRAMRMCLHPNDSRSNQSCSYTYAAVQQLRRVPLRNMRHHAVDLKALDSCTCRLYTHNEGSLTIAQKCNGRGCWMSNGASLCGTIRGTIEASPARDNVQSSRRCRVAEV
jgi:hypothetical protein